jgi:hypothetical protein
MANIIFPTLSKDPDATLDYVVDWTAFLAPTGDTIASVVWVVPSGLTENSQLFTATTATIWLESGTLGKTYVVICRITTVGGRTEDHRFNLIMQQH